MKSMSVLAAVSIAVFAVACKRDEPASDTFTTSAPVVQDTPAVQPQFAPQVTTGTTTTGAQTDLGNSRGGGATTGTTQTGTGAIQKGRDAGIVGSSDIPSGGNDLIAPSTGTKSGMQGGTQQGGVNAKDNHSTPLGDGKSGSYTDNKGTHGGKATWGTGPHKDTKMDQPTPAPAK